jgi:hypothetical protein
MYFAPQFFAGRMEDRAGAQRPRRRRAVKKLKMDMDSLVVESFEVGAEDDGSGTVHGNLLTRLCDTVNNTCDAANTCYGDTCDVAMNSCEPSCNDCGTYNCCSTPSNFLACMSDDGQCQGGNSVVITC